MNETAFVGIDVAFAKKKRLPIVVAVRRDNVLVPLPLRRAYATPPAGHGNARSLDDSVLDTFADDTVTYLKKIEGEFNVDIQAVAIDAPATRS